MLATEIERLFAEHRERYGSPRIYRLLVNAGWRVSRRRVARLMRSAGIRGRTSTVTCAVLRQAVRRRPARGVIFHSDRGSEYMAAPFCAYVAQLGFWQSANVRGPGDNAHAESFFHSLKAELTRGVKFPTEHALRRQLAHYIRYYNTDRFHSSLGYRSPIAFERCAA